MATVLAGSSQLEKCLTSLYSSQKQATLRQKIKIVEVSPVYKSTNLLKIHVPKPSKLASRFNLTEITLANCSYQQHSVWYSNIGAPLLQCCYSAPFRNWRANCSQHGWGTPIFQPEDDCQLDGVNTSPFEEPESMETVKNEYDSTRLSEESVNNNGCPLHSRRPRRIILVRHGQSEGNVDEVSYTKIPDSKIALTEKGWHQAIRCGERIRKLIESDAEDDWKVYFYVSPYQRTLQTLRGIGLAFGKERIAGVREEPRIREQDFGNFQDREKMRLEKEVRLRYGRFFYRFPDGESAADVYDRVTGFRETLRADIDIGRFQTADGGASNMNLVLVSHGLTLRVFLMRWYKWTVEQFEGLYNFSNTGMMVMQLGQGGRYTLTAYHTEEELRAFGMTDQMIADQHWQTTAKPGELNHDWLTSGPAFFDHFDALESGNLDSYEPAGLSDICDSKLIVP